MKQTSERKKRVSFDELLLAGVRAIADRGIDHVSVSDVAAISGVSRPTFYTYFGDMHGFYAEIWLRFGRTWLDAQTNSEVVIEDDLNQAILELFSASRRLPEVFEVVQPDFELWWHEQTGGNQIKAIRLVWQLGFKLGYDISKRVTAKSELGLPIVSFTNLPENVMENPIMAGLGNMDGVKLPPMEGLTLVPTSVEENLTRSAIEVIATSGVAAASMTRIARRARVSTGSVYPRFKNSEMLVQTSFNAAIEGIIAKNLETAEATGLGIDAYALTVNAGYGDQRKTWRNFRTEMHLEAAHNPDLAKYMEKGFETTAGFLEKSFVATKIMPPISHALAWYLHSHAIGISLIYNVLPEIASHDNRIMARWMFSQLPK